MADDTRYAEDIARDLQLPARNVGAAVQLLAGGATVPFVARYRKEATGSLDEVQLRAIEERLRYRRDLEARRATILEAVAAQGKLSDGLRGQILACRTKAELEDLYLPYKPKRRTRATMARERGLEPLAVRILAQPSEGDPQREALPYVVPDKGVADVEAALAGARDIVAERVAEHAAVRARVRAAFRDKGVLRSKRARGVGDGPTRFEQYYDFSEPVRTVPSHRTLAIYRGETEGVLRVSIDVDAEPLSAELGRVMGLRRGSPFAEQLRRAVDDAYRRLVAPSVENEVRGELKARADKGAVQVFADNLKDLLMAAPLGGEPVLAIDPGLRTGCKLVALDATGRLMASGVLHLHKGEQAKAAAERDLLSAVRAHGPRAIAVGNGTGGREAERFVRATLKAAGLGDVIVVVVNEAGASVYSASELARAELPDQDVTVRGAVSIGRRLQDPLAELVKIDPKAIGVGQYQHDVHQPTLARALDEVVEGCVNAVGVEVNTASAPLLSRVSGVGPKLAERIVRYRDERGAFAARKQLLKVPGLGPKAFEQAAGFLRVRGGAHPLDASAVHPERYALVERMARDLGVSLAQLVGQAEAVGRIELGRYVGDGVGEPTLRDILSELVKPGRDPRADFAPPRFRDDVQELEDLASGMRLEGVVTNVTDFGAFVDVGVHQDGLVHVSQLADRFVRDPREVVKVGDKLTVTVLDVDLARRRIALSARRDPAGAGARPQRPREGGQGRREGRQGGKAGRGDARLAHNPFKKLKR